MKKKILISIIIILVGATTLLIFPRSDSEEISLEEAKSLAIYKVYPRWDETKQYVNRDIVLDVKRDFFGNFIVHVCDINIECICRLNEGYWVKVSKEGSSVSIPKQNLCPFG